MKELGAIEHHLNEEEEKEKIERFEKRKLEFIEFNRRIPTLIEEANMWEEINLAEPSKSSTKP